ncbi:PREDICTED: uncharacterized protein LOC109478212 [Branchiostoma belcheri]|uniref:Uncharacterized protein LOC109478212 n=1 Tax=Branchiostoma belcheri TaxID=7741 RepID=A0A6P4ZER5_BRABE|nr:PREDICTED: uncharacterized protein LOC109478212 [Branchiostoma belcheri]
MRAKASVGPLGRDFAVTPDTIPVKEIVTATEVACQKLDQEEASLLRNEVVGILQNAKPPKPNLTKEEKRAIKSLKGNKDIVILPADKGKAVVVMDRTEYVAQCEKLLDDKNTYKVIGPTNPTKKLKGRLQRKLREIKKAGHLDPKVYDKIYPTSDATPSVPGKEVVQMAVKRAEEDPSWKSRTLLTPEEFGDLLLLVVSTTYFQYNNMIYEQTYGMAMGSPLSPVLANLFMEEFERKALDTAPHRPKFWGRYVDDTGIVNQQAHEQELFEHINQQHDSIKFTMEREQDGRLPMLDVMLIKNQDRTITTDVYRKRHTQTTTYSGPPTTPSSRNSALLKP